jgi:hypothetical protein
MAVQSKVKKTGSNGKAKKGAVVRDGFVMLRGEYKGHPQLVFTRDDDEDAFFKFRFNFGKKKAQCIKAFVKEIVAFADEANGDE